MTETVLTKLTDREESLDLMDKTLRDVIDIEMKNFKLTGSIESARSRGTIAGAKIGLDALSRMRNGSSSKDAMSVINSNISTSIYNLLTAEAKYEQVKLDRRANEIAYYDNLLTALQMLQKKFSILFTD